MTDKLVYLEITSWIGISIDAMHFYGSLKGHINDDFRSIELLHALTIEEAKVVSKASSIRFSPGDMYNGFLNKQDIINLALKIYKDRFPQAEVLVLGRIAIADPQEILDGPPAFKDAVNKLYNTAESIGWYDGGHEDQMNDIYKAYIQLLKSNHYDR